MRFFKVAAGFFGLAALAAGPAWAEDWKFDYSQVKDLQGNEFVEFIKKQNFTQTEMLEFFKHLPLSTANQQIYDMYMREDLGSYYDDAPKDQPIDGYTFTIGDGTEFIGPMSGQKLKDPVGAYIPVPEGPIGDQKKIYKIGFATHGFTHPWCLNQADVVKWEANRYPNVEISILDAEWDDARQARQIDTFTAQKYDAIMVWPRVSPPMGPPVDRAVKAGIPTITFVRDVGTDKITYRVHGFYMANAVYNLAYLLDRLMEEDGKVGGNVLLIRKALGATADGLRTGGLLRGLSYFPDIKIVGSYHNDSDRPESFKQTQDALMANPKVDIIFGTGSEEIMGAIQAVDMAKRWNSRDGGKKIITLGHDESREVMKAIEDGKIDLLGPYPPYLSGVSLRVLLRHLSGEKMPSTINAPDLASIGQTKKKYLGAVEPATVAEWEQYAFGPELK